MGQPVTGDEFNDVAVRIGEIDGVGLPIGKVDFICAARFSQEQGRAYLRRSPVAPLVWAVGMILIAMTLFFGTSYLVALAMLVLAFALGAVIGQVARELSGSQSGEGTAENIVTPEPELPEASAVAASD